MLSHNFQAWHSTMDILFPINLTGVFQGCNSHQKFSIPARKMAKTIPEWFCALSLLCCQRKGSRSWKRRHSWTTKKWINLWRALNSFCLLTRSCNDVNWRLRMFQKWTDSWRNSWEFTLKLSNEVATVLVSSRTICFFTCRSASRCLDPLQGGIPPTAKAITKKTSNLRQSTHKGTPPHSLSRHALAKWKWWLWQGPWHWLAVPSFPPPQLSRQ